MYSMSLYSYINLCQMQYGILLVCCKTVDGKTACVLRGLEAVMAPSGEPITNEVECPLLLLTQTIFLAAPSMISNSVSVVHECDKNCTFTTKQASRRIERESVSRSKLEYEHSFSNSMYCLNVYCMKN